MNQPKKKVLFVCLGNSCRSQMAEGFARTYGADVMDASSAGLSPAASISPLTIKVMRERNVDMEHAWPKSIYDVAGGPFDLIVNMCGYPLPAEVSNPVRDWTVLDPISHPEKVYVEVAQKVEDLVMRLILELRQGQAPQPSGERTASKPATADAPPRPMGTGGSRMYRRNRG